MLERLGRMRFPTTSGRSDITLDAAEGDGWVACTTDEFLYHKHDLYDVVVFIPSANADEGQKRARIETQPGVQRKATSRDIRRYRMLRRALKKHELEIQVDTASMELFEELEIAEGRSWLDIACNASVWWATAGAKGNDLDVEDADFPFAKSGQDNEQTPLWDQPRAASMPDHYLQSESQEGHQFKGDSIEIDSIAVFHQMTNRIVSVLSEIINDNANDDEDEPLCFTAQDMQRLGLHASSNQDVEFVKDFVRLWFDRDAQKATSEFKCCGCIHIGEI